MDYYIIVPFKMDRKERYMSVAKRIKLYLVENGIQQKRLAVATGIGEEKLSQSLNGKRKLETEEFAKIVNVLNVSADTFIKPVARDG